MTENYLSRRYLEDSVIPTTPKRENRNADEGGAFAPVQAQAHVCAPAHAQHTNTRTFNVRILTRKSWKVAITKAHVEDIKDANVSTLVRVITRKHANGYKLASLFRNDHTGTYIITLEKESKTEYLYRMGGFGHKVGASHIHNCPVKDGIRATLEGRQ